MYYTSLDPRTMKPMYVPKTAHEKAMQRALLQWRNPINHALIREALRLSGRDDLIGFGRECLVPPRDIRGGQGSGYSGNSAATGTRSNEPRRARVAAGGTHASDPTGSRGKVSSSPAQDRNELARGGTKPQSTGYRGESPRGKAGNASSAYRGETARGGATQQPQQRGRVQHSPQGGGSRGRRP